MLVTKAAVLGALLPGQLVGQARGFDAHVVAEHTALEPVLLVVPAC